MCLRLKIINWKSFVSFSIENDENYLIIDLIRPWHYWRRTKKSRYKLCKFYPLSVVLETDEEGKSIKNNYGVESLKNNYWYSSVASSFNDIADCNPSLLSICDIEKEYRKLTERDNIGTINSKDFKDMFVRTQLQLLNTKLGITCFSNEKNITNHLMWAHYGNYHKGICIKFNPLKIFPNRLLLPAIYNKRKPRSLSDFLIVTG